MQNVDLSPRSSGWDCPGEEAEAAVGAADAAAQQVTNGALVGLVRTIEGEIVPRLVLAQRANGHGHRSARPPRRPEPEQSVEFTDLLLEADGAPASAYVDALRGEGVPLEDICLHLLAPAARELGRRWTEDTCNFVQVTVALCRLHELLRELGRERLEFQAREPARSVLLATAPGEQHCFGVLVVAEFFRRAGWDVATEFPRDREALMRAVHAAPFAMVGLSVSCESLLDGLGATIKELRRASRQKDLGVMVGGRLFADRPQLATLVGADATASDARQAADQARSVVNLLLT